MFIGKYVLFVEVFLEIFVVIGFCFFVFLLFSMIVMVLVRVLFIKWLIMFEFIGISAFIKSWRVLLFVFFIKKMKEF